MMHVGPNPHKILEFEAVLNQGLSVRRDFDSAINDALPLLAEAWPALQALRLYRAMSDEQMQLIAASDSVAPKTMEIDETLSLVLAEGQPQRVEGGWYFPLVTQDGVAALVSLGLADDRAEAAAWARVIGGLITRSLGMWAMQRSQDLLHQEARSTRVIADNLVLASRLITSAETYSDMAQAAVYTIAQDMAAVALTLFDTPLDIGTRPEARALVALGLPEGAAENLNSVYLASIPDKEQLDDLWRGQPIVLDHYPADAFALAVEIYAEQVAEADIGWLAAFGLRAGEQVLGTLEILHRGAHQLSPEEIDAYNTLADQIGVSVRNRQLLRQTEESLEETRLLYELGQELIQSQDTLELLRALRLLAAGSSAIIHSSFEYNTENRLVDMVYRHILKPDTEQVFHQSVRDELGDEGLARIQVTLGGMDGVYFVENTGNVSASESLVLEGPIQLHDVGSMIVLPVRERGYVCDLVRVMFSEPRQFDERERRLYQSAQGQMEIVLQSLRFLQEAQISAASLGRQVSILRTLNELSTVITVATDEQQLLSQSIQALVLALEVDYSQVCLLDSSLETGSIYSEFPLQGQVNNSLEADALLTGVFADLEQPKSRVVADVDSSEFLNEAQRLRLQRDGSKSLLLLPLIVRGRLNGYIRLDIRQADKRFNDDMLEIAQTILVQVIVGLQNIRLLEESNRRSEQLQRVNHFVQMLQSTLDTDAVLNTVLHESQPILPVEWMQILLFDSEAVVMREAALFDKQSGLDPIVAAANGAIFNLDNGSPISHVWKNQALLHVSDTSRAAWKLPATADKLRSLIVTPLRAANKQLGVLSVGHSQPFIYAETDTAVFQQMTNQVANAIENANLYMRSRRGADTEALVNDIAVRLQQQSDLENLIQVAALDLGKALHARRARVRLGTRNTAQGLPSDERDA